MKSKVYVETTVISYLASRMSRDLITAANQQITQEWWSVRHQDFDLFVSQIVLREVSPGDEDASRQRLEIVNDIPLLELSEEALQLAEALVNQQVIPKNAAVDALHIAVAATNGMDYLITWNFKHIANAAMRSRIEYVCRLSGYEPPVICSPQELMES
jgi:hypothetical protein